MTTFTRSFVALAAVVFFATPALAGPPLICHPFETAGGKLDCLGHGFGMEHAGPFIRHQEARCRHQRGADTPTRRS